MDQMGDHMKTSFEHFQIQKWMLQAITAEKVDEKNGAICLVSILPSWVMVLKLSTFSALIDNNNHFCIWK